jgi:hypothetical protein
MTLEDELLIARDRIKELESALGIGDDLMPYRLMGFSPHEAAIVRTLMTRPVMTKEQALLAMYAEDPERRFDVQVKIVDTVICYARRKLRKLGISVETLGPGLGYRMSALDKARAQALLAVQVDLLACSGDEQRLRVNRVVAAERRHRADNGHFARAAE